MKEVLFAQQKFKKEKSVYTKPDTTNLRSCDKGEHKKRSEYYQPNHLKHKTK